MLLPIVSRATKALDVSYANNCGIARVAVVSGIR